MLKPGDILKDTYRVVSLQARGGMAYVYQVEHMELGVKRALKLLLPQYCADEECAVRFRREAQIMANLHHPNIVKVFDCGTTSNGLLYLVMEWLEGEDLFRLIQKEPRQPLPVVTWLIQQVGAALTTAHQAGIVHRDLKPGNIFVCRGPGGEKLLKVMDFGIARTLNPDPQTPDATRPGSLIGTPGYMAPEQFMETLGAVSPASDQFALAVIAYELLLGQRLFTSQGSDLTALYELAQRVMSGQFPPLPSEAEAALGGSLRRAMSRKPGDRFPSIAAFLAAIPDMASAAPATPPPSVGTPWPVTSESYQISSTHRRGRQRLLGLAVAMMAAVAAVVGAAHYRLDLVVKPPVAKTLSSADGSLPPSPRRVSVQPTLPSLPPSEIEPEPVMPPAHCPITLKLNVKGDPKEPLTSTTSRAWQIAVRRCIEKQSWALTPNKSELVLQRTATLFVTSPLPRAKAEVLELCLKQIWIRPVPIEVRVKAFMDAQSCGSERP